MLTVWTVAGADLLQAEEPRLLRWDDLRGSETFSDPFKQLDAGQRRDLGYYARLRGLIAAKKIPAEGTDAERAKEIESRLRRDGFDPDWLLSQQAVVRRMRERAGQTLNQELEQADVTLAGFVMPLERSGERVTEFLLVPAFDFCCRMVAPAPNQAVHVRSEKGISLRGRFAAAKITGTLAPKTGSWKVVRDTGEVDFKSVYQLRPTAVEVHQPSPAGETPVEQERVEQERLADPQ